ncbi:MAG: transcription elongation factor GreA [Chloroflexi bacterium]|nr:transcription elongation factor GreA [Chloroflexota bacterium]
MADQQRPTTLEEAAALYLEAVAQSVDQRARVEITRFTSWYGSDRRLDALTGHQVTQYQEALGTTTDVMDRLPPVKEFLAYAKKKKWTATNLGAHLRVKRTKRANTSAAAVPEQAEVVEMTADGLAAAKTELERLHAQRPQIQQALKSAMADKDFRENAPLDAARDAQGHLEGRIRQLEYDIKHAVVVAGEEESGRAHLGSSVTAINLVSGRTVDYTLVGHNEVDATAGKISIASPVGQAFVGRGPGDEVEVTIPSGKVRFRIETVVG